MASKTVSPAEAGVQVGDFFESSWGYDQTNIDFYKIVGLTPKGVKVQKWSSACVGGSGTHDSVVPGEGPATYIDWEAVDPTADHWTQQEQKKTLPAPVRTKRLLDSGWGGVSIKVRSFAWASKWDGQPASETNSYFGH